MGDEEPVTQQPSSDSPEQDTGTQVTDTSAENNGSLKPEDDPTSQPKYKP